MLSMAGPAHRCHPGESRDPSIHQRVASPVDPGFRRDDSLDVTMRAMKVSEFDFDLPPGLIADRPAAPRDAARLLVVDAGLDDRRVRDLPGLLRPGDLLVVND